MSARTVVVVCLVLSGAASAELLPPERAGLVPRKLAVLDDRDGSHDLSSVAAGELPTLLVPVFTRCNGTCPFTAISLKGALAKIQQRFRIVLLSFDADDTADDLRAFRERFALPSDWLLVRSPDAAATHAFLDELGFRFMKTGDGFDHPNTTFVLSPRGVWAGTFTGASFAPDELKAAWLGAVFTDRPTRFQSLRAWLARPESWIALSCIGLLVSLVALALAARTVRRSHQH
ncbi:MAG TPA: hypothetical protein VG496_15455 [Myxococcales bacterium]|nr:hypothetical protein [Myxococcales bacterium]